MNLILKSTQISRSFICNKFFNPFRLFSSSHKTPLRIEPITSKSQKIKTLLSEIKHPREYLQSKEVSNLTITRKIHSRPGSQVPRTPDLIYFPDILRWLKTKIKFKYLSKVWDPSFSEGAFIYGSTQAICRITEIINNNKVAEFEGLLTIPARIKLIEDMTKKLTRTQKEIIRIYPRDIKILVPMSVNLSKNGIQKHCNVSMRVLALKWFPQKSGYLRLVLVALQSEFSKDYTHGIDQDWNISGFDVMECTVLAETPSNTL